MGNVCNQILSPGVTFIIQLLWQKYTLYVLCLFKIYDVLGKSKKKIEFIFLPFPYPL